MPSLIGKIEPGDVIGRCRIIRELGRGGVGTVYLATHQTLQIEVALKVLSPALSLDNPALAERFIREAQLAARIRHPNVIAVMDAAHEETTGLYYIIMEYVGGGSLAWHLRHGPLPEAKALAIITGIAHALVVAEENQVVHRDIKPENIILDLRGTPKLADLGLAKQSIDSRTSLTLGGSFMGTPAYMSPEQARDAKVADTRDDIYSLGATFYECLTGLPPFQGETPYNIMSELLTKPSPKPRTHRPELSRAVDLVCRKMMAKTRGLRYANARSLVQELEHVKMFGDDGIEQLEAATFDQDSIMARQQALTFGIETSADGVALIPELPDEPEPARKPAPALIPPRKADHGAFKAAVLLLLLVTVATVLLAGLGSHHPLAYLKQELARWAGESTASGTKGTTPAAHPSTDENPAPNPAENPPLDLPPKIVHELPHFPSLIPPEKTPAPTTAASDETNAVPALPIDAEVTPVPAMPVIAQSAFEARVVAEGSLPGNLISPTGQAELVKIIGKRDSAQASPTIWTFYFFDKNALGHVQVVSVSDRKVLKNSERISLLLSPFNEEDILPDSVIDSSQALAAVEATIPGVTVTGSELVLVKKDNVPKWNITLWAKDSEGEEHELGSATVLAESDKNGAISGSTLKPNRIVKP
jgi:hypothetical protein